MTRLPERAEVRAARDARVLLRFALVSAVLVALVVTAAWAAARRFADLSAVVGERVADNGAEMASLDRVEAALGAEDDTVVDALTRADDRAALLRSPRARVDGRFVELAALLDGAAEQQGADEVRAHVSAYRRGVDAAIARSSQAAALDTYSHAALPHLRSAIVAASRIRQDRFRSTQHVAAWAQGETSRARGHVGFAALVAVGVVIGGAGWLARREALRAKDVTALARRDEMRSELLAVASHELRTPLTTLRLTLPLLEESSSPSRERELLAVARHGCDQLSTTIEEFLDFARIESGHLELSRTSVDVRSVIDDVVQSMRLRAEDAEVRLAVEVPAGELRANADRERLRAVVANVVANALSYTPPRGEVVVRTEAAPGRLRVTVSDTGPGVPHALRERVFEKFFRVEHHAELAGERSPTPRRGAGIGLYLSRQIMEAHGGVVRCDAAAGGNGIASGACFTIELPFAG